MKRVVILVLAVAVSAPVLLVAYLSFTGQLGLPMRWGLPPGYKGWIVLRYGVTSCQALKRRGIFWVVKVGEDGIACTSDPIEYKFRYDQFEYVSFDGKRVAVKSPWGATQKTSEGVLDERFIGSETELREKGYSCKGLPICQAHNTDNNLK